MTGAWGADTFPVRIQLSNPHFQNPQTFVFLVFLMFSSNKCWWWLYAFSFLGRRTREPCVALPPKGRLRQLATPLGTVFRELGHLILCNVLPWLTPLLVSFHYVLVYINSLLLLVRFRMYAWGKYLFIWCTQTLTLFAHTVSEKGPYTRVHGNIRSGGESVIMLGLRLAWLQWTLI